MLPKSLLVPCVFSIRFLQNRKQLKCTADIQFLKPAFSILSLLNQITKKSV